MTIAPNKRRWLILAVMFLAIIFNYVDRQIVSILKPTLKAVYSLGDSDYAVIINTFTICYALTYPVAGWLVDKFGVGKMMLYGVIAWSLACIGGGISKTVGQFTFFRGMLGVAEPTNFPSQIKIVAIWFPAKLRATAHSLCVTGSSIGAVIAPPLVVWLALTYNWQMVFIVCGAIGLFIALLWWFIYRDPPADIALEAIGVAKQEEALSFKWGQLWGTRSLWGILSIRFIIDPVWYFCLFWLPGYLQEKSNLTLAEVGMYGWIPFLVADIGGLGTAIWSDKLVKKGMKPIKARKIMLMFVAALGPLSAFTPFLSGAFPTLALFSVIAIVCLSWLHTVSLLIAEAFPVKNVASVLGIAGGCGALGAVIFNYFVGQMIGTVGAEKIFFAMAFMHPLAAVIMWFVVRKEKPKNISINTTTYENE